MSVCQFAPDEPRLEEERLEWLIRRLTAIRTTMRQLESTLVVGSIRIDPKQAESARNLMHYVALRQQDLRALQDELACCGLSSLGRCEAHVLDNVEAVLEILSHLTGQSPLGSEIPDRAIRFHESCELIAERTRQLFGPYPPRLSVHIMVTMPTDAALDAELVRDLVAKGMSCMRINCSHDGPEVWQAIIDNLRDAERILKRNCRILMDLGGPKLRTGPLEPGTPVLKWRPHRDPFGKTVAPCRIWLHDGSHPIAQGCDADASVAVRGNLLAAAHSDDVLEFRDARGKKRRIKIVQCTSTGLIGTCDSTAYLTDGIAVQLQPQDKLVETRSGEFGPLQPVEQSILLHNKDRLIITRSPHPGRPATGNNGTVADLPRIGCTLGEIFSDIQVGERVLFDDGKIEGVIEEVNRDECVVVIKHAREQGVKLRADKGINLPDTQLHLDALTEKDLRDLQFIVEHADIVGYSFVRRPDDVQRLQQETACLGRPGMPMILKIENRQAFERLPSLLLAAMRSPLAGIMIARGDLAVEIGYERLAEVQEEILWMCEAAHMPVVWATQVLERLAREGTPSRAEVTDAAMAVRAECVMLNKGPFILDAVNTLQGILQRMHDHQVKKRPMLRRLRVADDLTFSAEN